MTDYGRRPEHAPPATRAFHNALPVRMDMRADFGPLAGVTRWASVREFTHEHLCRAFDLDPAFYFFDLPSSIRGVGASSVGASSGDGKRRLVNGYVMYGRYPEPVGKLTVVTDGDRFRDVDPRDARDFLDLSHS